MKKYYITLTVILTGILFLSLSMNGQNAIPAFGIELEESDLVFEENDNGTNTLEERKINVRVEDKLNTNLVVSVTFMVQQLDGTATAGPFTISENETFEMDIDGPAWGVQVVSYAAGSELSVWTE